MTTYASTFTPGKQGRAVSRRRPLSVLLAGLLMAITVLAGLTTTGSAPASAARPPLVWGAYTQPAAGQQPQDAVLALESTIGRRLGVVRVFDMWNSAFPTSYDLWLRDTGRVPIFSVRAKTTGGTVIPWATIGAAQPGSAVYNQIAAWADKIKAYGGFMYLSFNHEPEAAASSANGTSSDFIAAWRNWVNIFRARGVTNVEFMWIMTEHSFPPQVPSSDARYAPKWYPGDAWVDHIGADAYNDYTCRGDSTPSPWKTLAQDIEGERLFGLLHPSKGVWLAEWASAVDPNDPTRRPAWVDQAAALFDDPGYEQFRGVSYFDANRPGTPCQWYLGSDGSVSNWAAMGQQSLYQGVAQPVAPPPPPPPVMLVAATPIGTGDAAVRDHLTAKGYAVTVVAPADFANSSPQGYKAVFVSSTSDATILTPQMAGLTVPVLAWKPYLYDDLGLTGKASTNTSTASGTSVVVNDAAAPFQSGLTGSVAILSKTGTMPLGVPAAGDFSVATVGTNGALFGVTKGGTLADGTASPTCRAALPLYSTTPQNLTSAGWQLIDSAVTWATNC